jgi:solute carrier family 25 (mitochondrial carnitine/acylcarnitine transporter), member 20/29
MQTSITSTGMMQSIREFGGVSTLFRGMAAPLASAAIINAIIFSSYGFSSRLYDQWITEPRQQQLTNDNFDSEDETTPTHDPWQKALLCGAFAGFVQCFVICPMEHVKCRLQIQQGPNAEFHGPWQATRQIVNKYGVQRLYQGWWSTVLREVPAFGLYFAVYDYLKDRTNSLLLDRDRRLWKQQAGSSLDPAIALGSSTSHTWLASAIAGGCTGSFTWAIVYPVDLIKSKIQTAPLDTPFRQLRMWNVGRDIVRQHGVGFLFRGLGITLVRAFPVNGTIFPVYEFTLRQLSGLGL